MFSQHLNVQQHKSSPLWGNHNPGAVVSQGDWRWWCTMFQYCLKITSMLLGNLKCILAVEGKTMMPQFYRKPNPHRRSVIDPLLSYPRSVGKTTRLLLSYWLRIGVDCCLCYQSHRYCPNRCVKTLIVINRVLSVSNLGKPLSFGYSGNLSSPHYIICYG